jgi:hypothetical protein
VSLTARRSNVLRNLIGGFLGGFGPAAFLWLIFLTLKWTNGGAHAPDPGHGLVYPFNNHGTLTYVSAFQATACSLLFPLSFLSFAVGAAIIPKERKLSERGRPRLDTNDPLGIAGPAGVAGLVVGSAAIFLVGPLIVHALNAAGIILQLF